MLTNTNEQKQVVHEPKWVEKGLQTVAKSKAKWVATKQTYIRKRADKNTKDCNKIS